MQRQDDAEFEAWTTDGDYDDQGRWHPRWMDDHGQWHPGWGWFDEHGEWRVEQGHYDADGTWVPETAAPVIRANQPLFDRDDFFERTDGATLEVVFMWRDQVLSVTPFSPTGRRRALTVGPTSDDDFVLEDLGFSGSVPLVRKLQDGTWLLMVSEAMTLRFRGRDVGCSLEELSSEGIVTPVTQGWKEVELRPGSGVEIDFGEHTFLLRFSDPLRLAGPGIDRIDAEPIPFIGMSAITHIVALLLIMTIPDGAGALELDGYRANDRFAQLALTEMQKEEPPQKPGWEDDEKAAPEAAKHAGEEGKAGDPEAADSGKRIAVRGPADNEDQQLARQRNREIAMNAGVARQVSSMWATADQPIGSDTVHALGSVDGREPGDSRGVFGMGVSDAGRGGGGDSWEGVGMGDVDTGRLRGVDRGCTGVDCGVGVGTGVDMGDRDTKVPEPVVTSGRPQMTGGLDREIIKRVVRQHYRELKYCYEKELQKNRGLSGQINVKFTIAGDGQVIAALHEGGSLESPAVASCVTGKIRRWVFPRQKGNDGMVIVKYPFRFKKG